MAGFVRRVLGRLAGASAPGPREAAPEPSTTSQQWRSQGNAALAQADLAGAAECYRNATRADPHDPLAWLNLGVAQLENAEPEHAEESLGRALSLAGAGDDFVHDAHFMRGRARQQRGDHVRAFSDYEAAVAAKPGFADALESGAQLLVAMGRHEEALQWARRAAAARPSPFADLLAAQALHALDRSAEALQALDAVLASHPDEPTALEGRGNVLLRMGRAEEALAVFERLLSLRAPTADALSNVAAALHRMGRFEEALQRCASALALQPDHRNTLYNQAGVLMEMLRMDEALEVSQRAMRAHPGDADLQWNCAIVHLLRGELEEGWALYESRWGAKAYGWKGPPPDFGKARWTGRESLAGESILLFAEQGLGDSIQFLRYAPIVAAQAKSVTLRLPRAIAGLASGLAPNCHVVAEGEPLPAFDRACALLSLPRAFATALDDLPAQVPYLQADASRVAAWRERLADGRGRMQVGVVWSGNPAHVNDRNRSIPLAAFRALDAPGCRFVSLQPEVRESDRRAYEDWPGLLRVGGELRDFTDTAALMRALDLVVTVDTSVAHLAGALACPVWILLPHFPDWRWMLGREDSPWYPTARLWRQPVAGDWSPVLAGVRAELERMAGKFAL
ncbi:MAG: tetratricopeptide repeat protein [Usitatibacter sp.]